MLVSFFDFSVSHPFFEEPKFQPFSGRISSHWMRASNSSLNQIQNFEIHFRYGYQPFVVHRAHSQHCPEFVVWNFIQKIENW